MKVTFQGTRDGVSVEQEVDLTAVPRRDESVRWAVPASEAWRVADVTWNISETGEVTARVFLL